MEEKEITVLACLGLYEVNGAHPGNRDIAMSAIYPDHDWTTYHGSMLCVAIIVIPLARWVTIAGIQLARKLGSTSHWCGVTWVSSYTRQSQRQNRQSEFGRLSLRSSRLSSLPFGPSVYPIYLRMTCANRAADSRCWMHSVFIKIAFNIDQNPPPCMLVTCLTIMTFIAGKLSALSTSRFWLSPHILRCCCCLHQRELIVWVSTVCVVCM